MKFNIRLKRKPIFVLAPMKCEHNYLDDMLCKKRTRIIGDFKFTIGHIDKYPVVIGESLIGMVNSALTTSFGIKAFKPKVVIVTGTSGAHNPKLHQNDIVLGKDMVEIGSYVSGKRLEGEGSNISGYVFPGIEVADLTPNKELKISRQEIMHSDEKLINIAKSVPYESGKLIVGTHGSGDVWNNEIDVINYLYEHRHTDVEEMEDFAVARVCKIHSIPVLAIRVVSNSAHYPNEVFNENCAMCCQKYTLDVIKKIIRSK